MCWHGMREACETLAWRSCSLRGSMLLCRWDRLPPGRARSAKDGPVLFPGHPDHTRFVWGAANIPGFPSHEPLPWWCSGGFWLQGHEDVAPIRLLSRRRPREAPELNPALIIKPHHTGNQSRLIRCSEGPRGLPPRKRDQHKPGLFRVLHHTGFPLLPDLTQ